LSSACYPCISSFQLVLRRRRRCQHSLIDGRVLLRARGRDRTVRQDVGRESEVDRNRQVRVDQRHVLTVGQLIELLLFDVGPVERLYGELLVAIRAFGVHFDALMLVIGHVASFLSFFQMTVVRFIPLTRGYDSIPASTRLRSLEFQAGGPWVPRAAVDLP